MNYPGAVLQGSRNEVFLWNILALINWDITGQSKFKFSYQLSSVAQSGPALCDPMECSTPGFPVLHHLSVKRCYVHWVGDSIQPSHPLPSPFPPAFNFSQHQGLLMTWLFTSDGQSIKALASVFPKNIQDWFPLGLTGLISLQSKGLLRVFPSITVQKHQFFSTQPSSWSNSHIHTWLLEKP